MDIKALRPRVFAADPEDRDSRRQWAHIASSFSLRIAQIPDVSEANKLSLLISHIHAAVYELISEASPSKKLSRS